MVRPTLQSHRLAEPGWARPLSLLGAVGKSAEVRTKLLAQQQLQLDSLSPVAMGLARPLAFQICEAVSQVAFVSHCLVTDLLSASLQSVADRQEALQL
jgi:hypothetical protein